MSVQQKTGPGARFSMSDKIEEDLLAANKLAMRSGSITPLLKKELWLKIQSRRLSEGKEELVVPPTPSPSYQISQAEKAKKRRRQEQNRRAAKRHRVKQKERRNDMLDRIERLEKTESELQEERVSLLRQKTEMLRQLVPHLLHCDIGKEPSAQPGNMDSPEPVSGPDSSGEARRLPSLDRRKPHFKKTLESLPLLQGTGADMTCDVDSCTDHDCSLSNQLTHLTLIAGVHHNAPCVSDDETPADSPKPHEDRHNETGDKQGAGVCMPVDKSYSVDPARASTSTSDHDLGHCSTAENEEPPNPRGFGHGVNYFKIKDGSIVLVARNDQSAETTCGEKMSSLGLETPVNSTDTQTGTAASNSKVTLYYMTSPTGLPILVLNRCALDPETESEEQKNTNLSEKSAPRTIRSGGKRRTLSKCDSTANSRTLGKAGKKRRGAVMGHTNSPGVLLEMMSRGCDPTPAKNRKKKSNVCSHTGDLTAPPQTVKCPLPQAARRHKDSTNVVHNDQVNIFSTRDQVNGTKFYAPKPPQKQSLIDRTNVRISHQKQIEMPAKTLEMCQLDKGHDVIDYNTLKQLQRAATCGEEIRTQKPSVTRLLPVSSTMLSTTSARKDCGECSEDGDATSAPDIRTPPAEVARDNFLAPTSQHTDSTSPDTYDTDFKNFLTRCFDSMNETQVANRPKAKQGLMFTSLDLNASSLDTTALVDLVKENSRHNKQDLVLLTSLDLNILNTSSSQDAAQMLPDLSSLDVHNVDTVYLVDLLKENSRNSHQAAADQGPCDSLSSAGCLFSALKSIFLDSENALTSAAARKPGDPSRQGSFLLYSNGFQTVNPRCHAASGSQKCEKVEVAVNDASNSESVRWAADCIRHEPQVDVNGCVLSSSEYSKLVESLIHALSCAGTSSSAHCGRPK